MITKSTYRHARVLKSLRVPIKDSMRKMCQLIISCVATEHGQQMLRQESMRREVGMTSWLDPSQLLLYLSSLGRNISSATQELLRTTMQAHLRAGP